MNIPIRRHSFSLVFLGTALMLGAFLPGTTSAQFIPRFVQPIGGVRIDGEGMLHDAQPLTEAERLDAMRQARLVTDAGDLARPAALRKVSLRRLEAAVDRAQQAGQSLPAEMRLLAGLTRVRYVLFDPERQDVILAGPAEPWTVGPGGEVVGTESGRPVLHLEDLIAALRYEFPQDQGVRDAFIGCSIDPTPEGVRRYNALMRRLGGIDRRRARATFAAMEQAMGPQTVRVFGVPATTRLAQVIVAADYRLKRIALGHDPSPVREVISYLDLEARTFRGQAVPQHRWWFVAGYDTVWQTPDGLGFELDGTGVRVETARSAPGQPGGQDEDPEDPEEPKKPATKAARQFAQVFTKHFAELAAKQPVFAELANAIGLCAAAALIGQKQDGPDAAEHWRPTVFLDDTRCTLPERQTPSQTPALVSYRFAASRHWLITISGGVAIDPTNAVAPSLRKPAEQRDLTTGRKSWTDAPEDEARWWWD